MVLDMYPLIKRVDMNKEESIRVEIERLQKEQRIFWTFRRKQEIDNLWREIESCKKADV